MRLKRLIEGLPTPSRESEGAGGYDIHAAESVTLAPGERRLVSTGFVWEIPAGMVGLVRPRSGLAVKQGLHVMAGVVDSDYRGEVKVLLLNLGDEDIVIETGDRVAQMVITIHYAGELSVVDDLKATSRGAGAFGSTGVRS